VDTGLLWVLSIFAIGSGQRSVWLAIGLGSLLLVWLYRTRSAFMVRIAVVGFAVVLLSTTALLSFPDSAERLANKFGGIVDPNSDKTANWRIRGWQAHLESGFEANPLFGQGLGGYYSWQESRQQEVTSNPHNAYVQIFLKFGLVGLLIYALLALQCFRKMMACRKKLGPGLIRASLEISILIFGASHGYVLGYGFQPIMLIFVALGMSAVKLCQERFRTSEVGQTRAVPNETRMGFERFHRQKAPEGARP
jgi:O-antigen ligase